MIENSNDWEEIIEKKYHFTTSDGIPIFEGDYWWWVNQQFSIYNFLVSKFGGNCNDTRFAFSTEKLARDYILENKPIFTMQNIKAILGNNIAISTDKVKQDFLFYTQQKLGYDK